MPSQAGPCTRSQSATRIRPTSRPSATRSARRTWARVRCLALLGGGRFEPHRCAQRGALTEVSAVEFPGRDLDAQYVVTGQQIATKWQVLVDTAGVVGSDVQQGRLGLDYGLVGATQEFCPQAHLDVARRLVIDHQVQVYGLARRIRRLHAADQDEQVVAL